MQLSDDASAPSVRVILRALCRSTRLPERCSVASEGDGAAISISYCLKPSAPSGAGVAAWFAVGVERRVVALSDGTMNAISVPAQSPLRPPAFLGQGRLRRGFSDTVRRLAYKPCPRRWLASRRAPGVVDFVRLYKERASAGVEVNRRAECALVQPKRPRHRDRDIAAVLARLEIQ